MRLRKKAIVVALFAAAAGFSAALQAGTVKYQSKGKASFTVEVPDGWDVTHAKEIGDYTNLGSEGGTVLQLRTIDGNEESLDDYAKEVNEYIEQNYDDVNLTLTDKDCTLNGLRCSVAHGSGKEKHGGAEVKLTSGVFVLNDGKVGECGMSRPPATRPASRMRPGSSIRIGRRSGGLVIRDSGLQKRWRRRVFACRILSHLFRIASRNSGFAKALEMRRFACRIPNPESRAGYAQAIEHAPSALLAGHLTSAAAIYRHPFAGAHDGRCPATGQDRTVLEIRG